MIDEDRRTVPKMIATVTLIHPMTNILRCAVFKIIVEFFIIIVISSTWFVSIITYIINGIGFLIFNTSSRIAMGIGIHAKICLRIVVDLLMFRRIVIIGGCVI